jgi:hypothetical protein
MGTRGHQLVTVSVHIFVSSLIETSRNEVKERLRRLERRHPAGLRIVP